MKILGINSSLRSELSSVTQQSSHTRKLLEIGLEHISKNFREVKTEIIDLGNYQIGFEQGAYSSNENFIQMQYPQQKDDMLVLYKKVLDADGIIFSSPTYWGYPSGLLKAFIDRLISLDEISDDPKKRRLQGKVAGAIATSKFDGSSRVAQDILSMANYLGFIIPPHAFAFHTGRTTTSVLEDENDFREDYFAKRNAQMVAENVYLMAKLVKNKKWRIFQEFTHPLSEDEKAGIFDLKNETKRAKKAGFYRNYNKSKGIV
jgi:multimeric flavodoxin WrbA